MRVRKLTDGERDILREQNADAYDDADDAPADVELVTEPCPGCGAAYTHPADECDPCCSAACADKFHAARQAEVNAALAAWWAEESKKMQQMCCVVCGKWFMDFPTCDGVCSQACGWKQAADLYADEPAGDDEIPF